MLDADRPWTPLHAAVHRTMRERNLAPAHQRLLVAISGGQDSLCLIRLLLDLQPKWSWSIAIAHCNHGWRADADANADYVQKLAQAWQVPFYSAVYDTSTHASIPGSTSGMKTEAAARAWRYRVLTELAETYQYDRIVTGHTASDRAETLLYNLLRGSGTDGLTALAWQRKLTPTVMLIRPFLGLRRAQTAEFCQARGLAVWQDETNQDWRYARNRIRQELLPYLQTQFNPQVEVHLAQTAEVLRAEAEFWEEVTQEWGVRCQGWTEAESEVMATRQSGTQRSAEWQEAKLNRLVLRSAALAIQRRVVRRWLQTTLGIAPNFTQIEQIVGLLTAPQRSQTHSLPGGAIVQVEAEWLVLRLPS